MDLIPGQEIKIPHATYHGLNVKKLKKKKECEKSQSSNHYVFTN